MKNFTFKKVPISKRLASITEAGHDIYDIKLGGRVVGQLSRYNFDDPYTIRFMVTKRGGLNDGNPNCPWMWITLKYKPTSAEDGKSYLKTFSKEMQEKFNLRKE